ncbi:MAG TPA: hypothetical protein VE861_12185 [Gemmatimonadaceae bacterium]|nr:hypothetical protein [Gemmatimonadaceae bacterium]
MTTLDPTTMSAAARRNASAHRRFVRLVPLAVCTLATVLTVTTAQAQLLGRMKRAVQERVQEPVRAGDGGRRGATDATRLEITPERLDAFVVAMRPLVQRAQALQAERDMETVRVRREKEYDACVERVVRAANGVPAPMTPDNAERLGAMTEQVTAIMGRYNAAAASGNIAALNAILDSADALGAKARIVQFPGLSACGLPAPRPTRSAPLPANQGELIAAGAGGMSAGEFGRLRERVAVYLLTQGSGDTYNDVERGALQSHSADLATLAPLFRSGVLDWAQWGSLASAWRAR